ncbi:MAG: hypothetical protein ACQEQG_09475 [Bacillota bacterium]
MGTRAIAWANENRTLIIVLVVAFLYPVLLFYTIHRFRADAFMVKYFLTVFSAIVLGSLALWAMQEDGISYAEVGLMPNKFKQALVILVFSGWDWA